MNNKLALGKIPPELLAQLITANSIQDPRVIVGPGIGLDCAVIDIGDLYLVFKSDPITFATDEIGWYAVHVNANDVATTGATPRWFLATLLLPEAQTDPQKVLDINRQMIEACNGLGITLVGGHTEVTYGLDRPIISGTMIGDVTPEKLVTPKGASPGDIILLTKSIPIEATAILANERAKTLAGVLKSNEVKEAQNYLHQPGISVVRSARSAVNSGGVSAMHDPTEGGLATALWELAEAAGNRLVIDLSKIPISPLSAKICSHFQIDPMGALASGSLLLTVREEAAQNIIDSLVNNEIACTIIGRITEGSAEVVVMGDHEEKLLPRPSRDGIARIFES